MNVQELIEIALGMKGLMPESSRAILVQRFLLLIVESMKNEHLRQGWQASRGTERFIQACKLESALPVAPPDMQIADSALAEFCNRWINVVEFKDENGEFKPLTPEMHSIRYTMIQELKQLCAKQKTA